VKANNRVAGAGNKSAPPEVSLHASGYGFPQHRRKRPSPSPHPCAAAAALKENNMLKLLRGAVTAVALAMGLSAMLAVAVSTRSSAAATDQEIAQALRAGGLVIVVRHGATFPDQADTDPLNFDNIAAQRNLNDKGKMLAKQFGDALRQVGVPVGKVYTSKYNRGYETAVVAGFKDIEKTADLTEGGLVVSPNETNRRAEAFHKLLAAPPKAGTDTILVTHYPNIIAALGKDWFDVKEGEASIFSPGEWQLHAAGADPDG
jgi:phosphohistidine phosphatase SixA